MYRYRTDSVARTGLPSSLLKTHSENRQMLEALLTRVAVALDAKTSMKVFLNSSSEHRVLASAKSDRPRGEAAGSHMTTTLIFRSASHRLASSQVTSLVNLIRLWTKSGIEPWCGIPCGATAWCEELKNSLKPTAGRDNSTVCTPLPKTGLQLPSSHGCFRIEPAPPRRARRARSKATWDTGDSNTCSASSGMARCITSGAAAEAALDSSWLIPPIPKDTGVQGVRGSHRTLSLGASGTGKDR